MVWVIGVILKDQRLLLNDGMALLADIFAQATGFLSIMARATQVPEVRGGEQNESVSRQILHPEINILTVLFIAAQIAHFLQNSGA